MGGHNHRRIQRCQQPQSLQQRERIEAELSAIIPIDPRLKELMSDVGFIAAFNKMAPYYESDRLAYDRLEDFYITLTGNRRYSEFRSFLNSMKKNKSRKA